ncbi:MAG: hypothetical protein BWX73_00916 [Lentisphaerae bacterium ADurb.Bin082]|nr:MAG: hypothetical protein BWX73_00916 [Lentisphaerae bacterium ADurb.Bin082]
MPLSNSKLFILSSLTWRRLAIAFWCIVGIISALVAITIVPSIFGSAGYNDEAWLVLLVQKQANGFWTSFSHYYRFMSGWGLAGMRTAVAVIHAISCAVFILGAECYYKPFATHRKWGVCGLWCIAALLPQVFWLGGIVLAPDYKFVAYDAALLGFGLLFLGLKGHAIWLVLSGACFVQILFSLPPAAIIAPLLLFIVWLESPKKSGWFILGGLLGMAVFFLFISSWQDFMQCFAYSGHRLQNTAHGRHGLGMLVTGYCKILGVFTASLLPTALALYLANKQEGNKRFWSVAIALLLVLATFSVGTMRLISWRDGGCPACSLDIFLALGCYILFNQFFGFKPSRQHWQELLLWTLFILVPVAFCTGTDKGFENRLTFYAGTLFVGIAVWAFRQKDKLALLVINIFLILTLLAGLIFWGRIGNFGLRQKTSNALHLGFPSNAPISAGMSEHLRKLDTYTEHVKIVANDPLHWYVPYLLKKPMLHLTSFRYYQYDDIAAMIAEQKLKPRDIILLEAPEYALPEERLDAIQKALNASRMERIIIGETHHIIRFSE